MVRWEAVSLGVNADVGNPVGPVLSDDEAQQASPVREVPDPRTLLIV